jgi:YegS/Rv2252/BmrU family lipid kinase
MFSRTSLGGKPLETSRTAAVPPQRVLLVFNPTADRSRAGGAAQELRRGLESTASTHWVATQHARHAEELAARAADEGYDVVAAVGGDGTVHGIVNGLMKIEAVRRPALGIVPIGSGNDFAFAAQVDLSPEEALQRIFAGRTRPVDVGTIRDESGRTEYWMSTVGIGFDAAVAIESASVSHFHGFLMYLAATLKTMALRFDNPILKIAWDAGGTEGPIPMLTVGNGPREGGGFMTTPAARVDDGQLDFVYFERVSRFGMLRFLPHVMKGTHGRFRQVNFGRTTKLVVESDRALPIHADGEIFSNYDPSVRHITIEIVCGAIRLIH